MNAFARLDRFLSSQLTPAVKRIFLINIGVFAAIAIGARAGSPVWTLRAVSLAWSDPAQPWRLWQYLTYMFVHETGMHLLFNMMALWFFAPELETRWGTSRFWRFYLIVGAGAALLHAAYGVAPGGERDPVIGASGALFGVLLAFGAYYPYRTVFIWGVLPILMKYLIPLIILAELYFLRRVSDNISHFIHLAGLAVAYLYLSKYHRTSDIRRWRFLR